MNNDPLKKIFPPRFLNLISDYYYFLKKGAGNVANCSLTIYLYDEEASADVIVSTSRSFKC